MKIIEKLNNRLLYFWCLALLGISIPVSEFATSVSLFAVGVNWILEGNYKNKFNRAAANIAFLGLAFIVVSHLIGLARGGDFNHGINDLKRKLPLLVVPFIVASGEPVPKIWIKRIFILFILSSFVGTVISFCAYLHMFGFEYNDSRDLSLFISHIRFSLIIVLCISFLLYNYNEHKWPLFGKWLNIFFIFWFVFMLIILKSITGFVILPVLLMYYFYRMLQSNQYRLVGVFGFTILCLGLITIIISIVLITKPQNSEKPLLENLPTHTVNGNAYMHILEKDDMENGNYIFLNLCVFELEKEWNKVSDIDYKNDDSKGQLVRHSLFRYLTSKGLTKDSVGIAQLSAQDIRNIENGIANYRAKGFFSVYYKLEQEIVYVIKYFKGANPSGHSVAQRFEYLKAATHIIKNNLWFGVGNSKIKTAYAQAYEEINTQLIPIRRLRAHNQFITFIVCFGIIWGGLQIVALLLPVYFLKGTKNYASIMFAILAFMSFLNEDTLETHTAISFFAFFYALLIINQANLELEDKTD